MHLHLLKNPWTWLALSGLAIAIAAQFFPLTAALHYEFSAVIALWASLGTGVLVVSRRERFPDDQRPSPRDAFFTISVRSVLVAVLPLLLQLLLAPFRDSCGMVEGMTWYLLLVPASAWISAVLGTLSNALVERRWVRILLFVALWSGSLFRGAHEAYWGPHIFMYSWQTGFFPGGSWDAELPITGTLVIYRLAHLLVAGALALVALEYARARQEPATTRWPPNALLLPALCAVLAVAVIPFRSELGLTRSHEWIRQELGDSLHTRFTTIYYNAARTDSLDIWRAANYADFYVDEHARTLQLDTASIERLTLYLYPTAEDEKRMVGTSSAAFTKPWLGLVNMPIKRAGSTLRHELAHLMLARFGGVLGVSISQGLLEGSAMALENNYGWQTLHDYARAMYHFELAPPVDQIMSIGGFSSRRASVAYVLAGSFSQWLIERYGIKPYLDTYGWGDFDDAYGKSLHDLSDEYQAFIDSIPPPPESYRPTMRYLFGGGSFFVQKCLRRIGTLNSEGFSALAQERYDEALHLFEQAQEEGINYSSRTGILQALYGLGRYQALLDSATVYARDTASYPLLPMLIEQGDAYWALGDTASARKLYDSVVALDISQSLLMRGSLRRMFLSAPPKLHAIMRTYYTRPMKPTQRLLVLQNARNVAQTSREQNLLSKIEATLIADQLPITAISTLVATLNRHGLQGPDSSRWAIINGPEDLLENDGVEYLLRDAIYYSMNSISIEYIPHVFGAGIHDLTNSPSSSYLFERSKEAMQFLSYIAAHGSIRP